MPAEAGRRHSPHVLCPRSPTWKAPFSSAQPCAAAEQRQIERGQATASVGPGPVPRAGDEDKLPQQSLTRQGQRKRAEWLAVAQRQEGLAASSGAGGPSPAPTDQQSLRGRCALGVSESRRSGGCSAKGLPNAPGHLGFRLFHGKSINRPTLRTRPVGNSSMLESFSVPFFFAPGV